MSESQDSTKAIAKKICEARQQLPGPEFVTEFRKVAEQIFNAEYTKTIGWIKTGESTAVEFGLVYLEVQPYFRSSQYIRTKLIRLLKHSPLSLAHAERLKRILELEHDKKMKSPATAVRKIMGDESHKRRLRKPYA